MDSQDQIRAIHLPILTEQIVNDGKLLSMPLLRPRTTRLHYLPLLITIGLLPGCYDNNSPNTSGTSTTGVVMLPGNGDTVKDPVDTAWDDGSDSDLDDLADWDSEDTDQESPYTLTLSWHPSAGLIDGYMIFQGPTPESATALLSITLETTVHYDATMDLGLNVGDESCFRIKAYNAEGASDFSDAVCFTYT